MPGENSGSVARPTPTPKPSALNPSIKLGDPQSLIDAIMKNKPGAAAVGGSTDFYKTFPAGLKKEDKISLQQTMLDIGAYSGIKINPVSGLWNPDVDGKAFQRIVEIAEANGMYEVGPTGAKTKTPDYRAVLAIGAADPKAFAAMFTSSGSAGSGYAGPQVTISTSDTRLNDQKLKAAVNSAYLDAVGREATAEEIAKAVQAVNAGNQSTTTTTVSRNKKGQTVTDQVTTPGVDAGQLIQDQARSNPEYAPYQMATTYFDAMLSALNGPVGQGA